MNVTQATREQAQKQCKSAGFGDLVAIEDAEEDQILRQALIRQRAEPVVYLTSGYKEVSYYWASTNQSFSLNGSGIPPIDVGDITLNATVVDLVSTTTGYLDIKWKLVPWNTTAKFICEITTGDTCAKKRRDPVSDVAAFQMLGAYKCWLAGLILCGFGFCFLRFQISEENVSGFFVLLIPTRQYVAFNLRIAANCTIFFVRRCAKACGRVYFQGHC